MKKISQLDNLASGDIQDTDLLEVARPNTKNYSFTWANLKTALASVFAGLTHKTRHQSGGADELNVAGLSGELADNQPAKTHGNEKHSSVFLTDTAVHGNEKHSPNFSEIGITSGKINALTEKTTLASDDLFVIEDSAVTNTPKKAKLSEIRKGVVVREYTSNDTWTKPAGLKAILVELKGGGGGGGRFVGGTFGPAAGGGGGGWNKKIILADDLGATENVVVGLGGAGKSANASGDDGGVSNFGTHLYAYGGGGGTGGIGNGGNGGGQLGINDLPFPVSGSGGTTNKNGIEGGGGGGHTTAGSDTGGKSLYGGGGGGAKKDASGIAANNWGVSVQSGRGGKAGTAGTNGENGQFPSGGGGAYGAPSTAGSSGAGANGLVRIIEYY